MEKTKVGKDKLAEILAKFTENLSKESQYRSITKSEKGKQVNLKKIKFEIFILNMFIITWLCQNKKFSKDLLDLCTINMYERVLPLLPEGIELGFSKWGNAKIHLPRETLLAAFEQEWLNDRYAVYYKAVKNLESDSGTREIGKIIVKNLCGNMDDPIQTLKAGTSFIVSLKHISNYLDNLEID